MAPLSRIIFSSTFLAILTSIVLHSCTKDQILPDDDFKIDTEDHLFGKMKSDFGTHVLLKLDSTLWIWSWNFSGQLGTGTNENSDIPLQVPITEKIVDFDIAAGMVTAIDCIGNIWFWGSDMHSSMMWPEITSPINCSYLNGAKAIGKVFDKHNILREDGTVWAWGRNSIGQLGDGSSEDRTVPVQVKGLDHIVQISANYDFNLALRDDGTVWFWGFTCVWDEPHDPIGINTPVKIDNLDQVVSIFADATSLVMKDDNTYWYFDCEDRNPQLVSFE